jgi:hypothetical protein
MVAFTEGGKPWFWAMNGMASVLAGVASLALAMTIGLSWTVWCGILLYLLAGMLLFVAARRNLSAVQ